MGFVSLIVRLLIREMIQWKSEKQGRIHSNTVADGWAGAVMQKPLEIQKYLGPTDLPTDRHGKVLSRVSATKNCLQRPEVMDRHTDGPSDKLMG